MGSDRSRREEAFSFPAGPFLIILARPCLRPRQPGTRWPWPSFLKGCASQNGLWESRPIAGSWLLVLPGVAGHLGAAMAAAYEELGAFVAAFLIPLLFARLGLLGARDKQELSERLRQQQGSPLKATEQVFKEREDERKRIAGEIHDGKPPDAGRGLIQCRQRSSLPRGRENGRSYSTPRQFSQGDRTGHGHAEDSLVDLRRSSVEEGGLLRPSSIRRPSIDAVGHRGRVRRRDQARTAGSHRPGWLPNPSGGPHQRLEACNSSAISVRVTDIDNMVHIIVQDKGSGFDPDAETASGHVGMKLMQERVDLVGGSIEFHSVPGGGTRLEARLPGGMPE